MFNKFLSLIKKDYWKMDDYQLIRLAKKYHIGDNKNNSATSWLTGYKSKLILPNEWETLSYNDRKELIDELIERDKFTFSNLTWLIAILSLVISIFQFIR